MSRNPQIEFYILVEVGLAEKPSSFGILMEDWVECHLMLGAAHIFLYLHLSANESATPPQNSNLPRRDFYEAAFRFHISLYLHLSADE